MRPRLTAGARKTACPLARTSAPPTSPHARASSRLKEDATPIPDGRPVASKSSSQSPPPTPEGPLVIRMLGMPFSFMPSRWRPMSYHSQFGRSLLPISSFVSSSRGTLLRLLYRWALSSSIAICSIFSSSLIASMRSVARSSDERLVSPHGNCETSASSSGCGTGGSGTGRGGVFCADAGALRSVMTSVAPAAAQTAFRNRLLCPVIPSVSGFIRVRAPLRARRSGERPLPPFTPWPLTAQATDLGQEGGIRGAGPRHAAGPTTGSRRRASAVAACHVLANAGPAPVRADQPALRDDCSSSPHGDDATDRCDPRNISSQMTAEDQHVWYWTVGEQGWGPAPGVVQGPSPLVMRCDAGAGQPSAAATVAGVRRTPTVSVPLPSQSPMYTSSVARP